MTEEKIFELKDYKPVPDPIHTYSRQIKSSNTPIVIDNGSYHCRAGWAHLDNPLLIFKNLVAKPRKERGKKDGETQVGNDITNIEAVRFQLRSPFDRDVVTNFEAQEQVLDYVFAHLGIDKEGCVPHPLIMTETFLNPNYSRSQMSELLFEAYEIPSVAYGVDALLSLQRCQPDVEDCLVVRLGHQTCHILPVLGGRVQPDASRRLNIGGFQVANYLHRLLQLRHSLLAPAISLSRTEELLHKHCFISTNFQEELSQWGLPGYQEKHAVRVQLPFVAAPAPTSTATLTPEQQLQRRRDLAKRLGEMNARKREERLAEDEEQLSQLMLAQELMENGEDDEYQRILDQFEISNEMELGKMISQLQQRIEKARVRIAAAANISEEVVVTPAAVAEVETKTSKLLQEIASIKEPEELDAWIADLKQKRHDLLEKRSARRQRRQDMAKRRTAAAQERMRIISQLARKDKRDDNFGMRDEDWDVYKVINKDGGDSDSEEENERLAEFEEVLRRYAPDEQIPASVSAVSSLTFTRPESYQLALCTEMLRAPELLFQPNMAGHDQGGIVETIEFALKRFSNQEQNNLVNNIFVTGGAGKYPGVVPRLEVDLRAIRPFGSTFKVSICPDPSLSAWRGARDLARSPTFEAASISRAAYLERGGDFLIEHAASNPHWGSSPLPEVVNVTQDMEIFHAVEVDVV